VLWWRGECCERSVSYLLPLLRCSQASLSRLALMESINGGGGEVLREVRSHVPDTVDGSRETLDNETVDG